MGKKTDVLAKFQAFSPGRLVDTANVIRVLQRHNISNARFLEAVEASVEEQKKRVRAEAAPRQPARPGIKKTQQAARQYPQTLACPKCLNKAYAQPVCPSCKKGRAGIRREYICGECNFVFYLD